MSTAATLFRKLCYENKNALSAGIICGGWDPIKGGEVCAKMEIFFVIFFENFDIFVQLQVYSITMGGSLIKQPFALGGSGSIYIYGWVDDNYKPNMTQEECLAFVRTGLALAISR